MIIANNFIVRLKKIKYFYVVHYFFLCLFQVFDFLVKKRNHYLWIREDYDWKLKSNRTHTFCGCRKAGRRFYIFLAWPAHPGPPIPARKTIFKSRHHRCRQNGADKAIRPQGGRPEQKQTSLRLVSRHPAPASRQPATGSRNSELTTWNS